MSVCERERGQRERIQCSEVTAERERERKRDRDFYIHDFLLPDMTAFGFELTLEDPRGAPLGHLRQHQLRFSICV